MIYLINDTHYFKTVFDDVAKSLEVAGYKRVTEAKYRRHAAKCRRANRKTQKLTAWDAETATIAAEAVAEAIAIIRDGQR